jgi:hypothetical protein
MKLAAMVNKDLSFGLKVLDSDGLRLMDNADGLQEECSRNICCLAV